MRPRPRRASIALSALLALAVLAGTLAGFRWLRIDSCLDRGAAWDYAHGACVIHPQPAPP